MRLTTNKKGLDFIFMNVLVILISIILETYLGKEFGNFVNHQSLEEGVESF
ncbi:MAG: hypothetical protein ACTSR2_13445 [Candidatus Hodarchaeales archaeon]